MQALSCPLGNATLMAYTLRDEKKHPAVIICPGGGYEYVSPRESTPVAMAWNRAGYNAFVLEYDCQPQPLGNLPLCQLAWAVSMVRYHAEKLNNTQQVAVAGFSAGAHLAASLGVLWNEDKYFAGRTEAALRRPDAMVLAYPVITAGEYAHRGSFNNLAGEEAAEQNKWSLETLVTPDAVPAFMWHTFDDGSVLVDNTLLFSAALRKAGVQHEVHLFPHGLHGLSLATHEIEDEVHPHLADAHVANWFSLAAEWLTALLENEAQC